MVSPVFKIMYYRELKILSTPDNYDYALVTVEGFEHKPLRFEQDERIRMRYTCKLIVAAYDNGKRDKAAQMRRALMDD